jgi:hypothetical protein
MLYEEEGPPLYDHLDQVRPTLWEGYPPTGDYGGDMLYEEEGPPLYDHLDQVRPTL